MNKIFLVMFLVPVLFTGVLVDHAKADDLTVSQCQISPSNSIQSPVGLNTALTFTAVASGGTGNYTYSWTQGCTGAGITCQASFSSAGTYTAFIEVKDGQEDKTSSCSAYVASSQQQSTGACSNASDCGTNGLSGSLFCQGNNIYQNYTTWTCNNPNTANSACSSSQTAQEINSCSGNQTCSNGSCSGSSCISDQYQQCVGNNLYWYNSCNQQQGISQYCPNGCSGNYCSNYNNNYNYNYNSNYNNCMLNSYQQCVGNDLYWYNSCNQQQGISQYCPNGCSGSQCINNNVTAYGDCTYHAYELCVGNNIYWYDSCGTQQDFAQACTGANLACKYGKCVLSYQPVVAPVYTAHYRTACYSNNVYWYDSVGKVNGLYKDCTDSNSCTIDSCSANKCSNILKCDGSTCATGSADYNNYCANNAVNTTTNNNAGTSPMSVSFFAKQDPSSSQWEKTVQTNSNGQVYFMANVVNNSGAVVSNANISANIPTEITSLGNLKIDGVLVLGDIVSGVNIGSLSPGTSKSITFEGKTQVITAQATKQATATVNASGPAKSDSVSVVLTPGQVLGASVSAADNTSGIMEFLKRWYLWIIVALILIFLFIVVFKRLSSNA